MKLIAGIDPGTTVGWALLDTKGDVVALGSQKELSLDSLIATFVKYGKVMVIGSDKAKLPGFVQDAAAKLGARVFCPSQDISVDEKRQITVQHNYANTHEMDALASAKCAMRKIQPLLHKIHLFLEREKRLSLFEEVAELVLKEEISIRAAIAILTPQEIDDQKEIPQEKRDEDIVKLYTALSRVRRDNILLAKRNRELENKITHREKELEMLKKRTAGLVKPKSPDEIVRVKESQIASLAQLRENALRAQQQLRHVTEQLEYALLQQDRVAVPRLVRLGWDEVMRNKHRIHGSIIFVDDANQMSEKAITTLHKQGIQLILTQKLPGIKARAHLPFACVQAHEYEQFENIVLVSKAWLEQIRSERAVLTKIVESYKKERSTERA